MTGNIGIQFNCKSLCLDDFSQKKKLPMELTLFIYLLFVGIQNGEGNGLYINFFSD